jgi:hypothetical protein
MLPIYLLSGAASGMIVQEPGSQTPISIALPNDGKI